MPQLGFDFLFQMVGVRDAEVVVDEALAVEERMMIAEKFDRALIGAADLIPVDAWGGLQSGGKGKVCGAPNSIGDVTRGDGEIGESDV